MSATVSTRWFWSDWVSDPGLRASSLAARGLWKEMLCIAAANKGTEHGFVLIGGKVPTADAIARMVGAAGDEVQVLIAELETNGVFSRDRRRAIYCRRMVRAEKNRKNGRLGGNPNWMNNKDNRKSVGIDTKALIPEPEPEPESGAQTRKVRTRGSRLSPDWKPTIEQIAMAKAFGLTERDIAKAADEFRDYWCDIAGAKGVKLSWDGTWRNRCRDLAERWGRIAPKPKNGMNCAARTTRGDWEKIFRIFRATSNWPGPGPAPGKPGCMAPPDLRGETLL